MKDLIMRLMGAIPQSVRHAVPSALRHRIRTLLVARDGQQQHSPEEDAKNGRAEPPQRERKGVSNETSLPMNTRPALRQLLSEEVSHLDGAVLSIHGVIDRVAEREISGRLDQGADLAKPAILMLRDHPISETFPTTERYGGTDSIPRFHFNVWDLWDYLSKPDDLRVMHTGHELIFSDTQALTSLLKGQDRVGELLRALKSGKEFDSRGKIQIAKSSDHTWKREVLEQYRALTDTLADRFPYPPFLIYGSLLGAVRDGGVIERDFDFDCAVLIHDVSPSQIGHTFRRICLELSDAGFSLRPRATHAKLRHPDVGSRWIDLFYCGFDDEDSFAVPFGTGGRRRLTRSEITGFRKALFEGYEVLIPDPPEPVLEVLYGYDWAKPDPNWSWSKNRIGGLPEAKLAGVELNQIYWRDYYRRASVLEGSPFYDYIHQSPYFRDVVVDIGCGNGRDSVAFGKTQSVSVLGLDAESVAIDQAREVASSKGLENVRFEVCDVADLTQFKSRVEQFRGSLAERLSFLFYMRFFLHSVDEDHEEAVLEGLRYLLEPGDVAAFEFRTLEDRYEDKVFRQHYRRFIDAEEFRRKLVEEYGWKVNAFVKGKRLSPFKDEDPYLARIVAEKSVAASTHTSGTR